MDNLYGKATGIFCLLLCVFLSAAARAQVTLTIRVNQVKSGAYDNKFAESRHIFNFKFSLDGAPLGAKHCIERKEGARHIWWTYDRDMESYELGNRIPEKINIDLEGFEDENAIRGGSWGCDNDGKENQHCHVAEPFSFPVDLPANQWNNLPEITCGKFSARISYYYTVAQPSQPVARYGTNPASNFCAGEPINLSTDLINIIDYQNTRLQYAWQYHIENDDMFLFGIRVPNWRDLPSQSITSGPSTTYVPGSRQKIQFRVSTRNKSTGTLVTTSAPAPYVHVFDPPPYLAPIAPGTPTLQTASEAVQESDYLRIDHVACRDARTGRISIKRVDGAGSYYYNLRHFPESSPGTYSTSSDFTLNIPSANTPSAVAPVVFPGLPAGKYLLIIENLDEMNGIPGDRSQRRCYTNPPIEIYVKQPAQPVSGTATRLAYNNYHISCNGANDGRIEVLPSGGVAPYTISLLDGITPAGTKPSSNEKVTFEALLPGKAYTVRILDALGCSTDITIGTDGQNLMLTEPAVITAISTPSTPFPGYNIACAGGQGSITVSPAGGNPPYKVSLNNGPAQTVVSGQSAVFPTLPAGTYQIRVEDANYAIQAAPATRCFYAASVTLTQPDPLTFTTLAADSVNCYSGSDGSVALVASGGIPKEGGKYTYSIKQQGSGVAYRPAVTDAAATFGSLPAGTYVVSAEGAAPNCAATTSITVHQPDQVTLASGSITPVTCKGGADGTVSVHLGGGTRPYTVTWTRPNGQAEIQTVYAGTTALAGLVTGTYQVSVKDKYGCQAVAALSLVAPEPAAPLALVAQETQPVSCYGGSDGAVSLAASGGWQSAYSYSKDNIAFAATSTLTGYAAGTHTAYVKDARGCTRSVAFTITQPAPVAIAEVTKREVSCKNGNDGSITLTVTGGVGSYEISRDGQNWSAGTALAGFAAGTYTLSVRDANDCRQSTSITITEPTLLTAAITRIVETTCFRANGSATVTAAGGTPPYQYTWYTQSGTRVGTDNDTLFSVYAGVYLVQVTDAKGCKTNPVQAIITNEDAPEFRTAALTPASCYEARDGSITLQIVSGKEPITVTWPDGHTGLSGSQLSGGEHVLSVRDGNGCVHPLPVRIPAPLSLVTSLLENTPPVCHRGSDGRLRVETTGGTLPCTYTWNFPEYNGKTELTNLKAAVYILTVQDAKGCTRRDTFHIADPAPVRVKLGMDKTLCVGQRSVLDAGNPGASYQWSASNGFTAASQQVTVSEPGTYFVTVTDGKGCIGKDTLVISTSNDLLKADFLLPTTATVGDTVVAVEISSPVPDAIWWETSAGTLLPRIRDYFQEIVFSQPGTYTVKVAVGLGECRDTKEQQITVYAPGEEPGGVFAGAGHTDTGISEVRLYPNPNDGAFSVELQLYEPGDVQLYVYALQERLPLASWKGTGKEAYQAEFNLQELKPGTYLVVIKTRTDYKGIRFIVR